MPKKPKSHAASSPYVDLHGRPLDLMALRREAAAAAAAAAARAAQAADAFAARSTGASAAHAVPQTPDAPARAVEIAPADIETVFDALCLAGCARGKTWLMQFLRQLERRSARGAYFTADEVAAAMKRLRADGRVIESAGSGHDLPPALRSQHLPRVLAAEGAAQAWQAWARASSSYGQHSSEVPRPELHSERAPAAMARLLLNGGLGADAFTQAVRRMFLYGDSSSALAEAATTPFIADLFERLDAGLRQNLLTTFSTEFNLGTPPWQPMMDWLDARLASHDAGIAPSLRVTLAERRLHRGDLAGCRAAVAGLQGPGLPLLDAAALAHQGRWSDAAALFTTALRDAAKGLGVRRGIAPPSLVQFHLLALLAQSNAAAWTQAFKFAVAESGSRKPSANSGWGLWAHAAAVRLGDEPLQLHVLMHAKPWRSEAEGDDNADRLILAAWLDERPEGWTAAHVGAVVRAQHQLGRPWKADLLRQACARLGLPVPPREAGDGPPWPVAYFGLPQEAWRDALAAIEALGATSGSAGLAPQSPTLIWQLSLDSVGRIDAIEVLERSVGARGPGRPKPITLAKLKKSTRLDPRDAAVARCIVADRWRASMLSLDAVGAAIALVGHPAVVFADAPDRPVELREALPVLEVRRVLADDGSESFVFELADPVSSREAGESADPYLPASLAGEAERRNSLRIVRDGAEQARLIRISPAQRRVAELVAKKWAVPVAAKAELDAALRVLAGHFQLHSDAEAGEAVDAEPRLRAQLEPSGDGLRLRLRVQPFGGFGPALVPGRGRARLMTLHQGLGLATERDLDLERRHLDAVFQALPFLAETDDGELGWRLDDPEEALAVVERLPQLPDAVVAVDWPRGRPVRVISAAPAALQVRVASGADWFALDGELQVDEGRVIGLQRLMQLAHESRRGRFVALGEGEYLALTEKLRQQLADLRALGQPDKSGLKLPAAAAAWLAETLDDASLAGDKAWSRRSRLLDEAAALDPAVPPGLQAQLRGYQAEGYAWMARLAHAGLGACLADDMGLGKTVQTLALLLARADAGPALVIAPTSVCGNWLAECERFAPGLKLCSYGEGERAAMLAGVGAGDLVVASYALAQIDVEAFARVEWATLVLDEAQALKNAATKRAKSVATLSAGFRLALTGTPVENRLADLWSIMNLLNPGLLGSSGQFGERFAAAIERQRDDTARLRLRRLVSPFLLRRTKAQVLTDLPPRTEIVHRVEPGPEERSFLEATRRTAIERVAELGAEVGDAQAGFHVLAELTRLRRAACDPRLVAPQLGIVGAKVHEFEQLAVELVAGRHKALVFSQFTDFLALLVERLKSAGIAHQYLDGSTPAAERSKRVAAFQRGEGDLFLISLKAGGFGLNLTAADYVIIVDPWWNPAAEDQAMGRAHRIGQQRPVTVYRLVTAGSIEERIVELHRDKRTLADGILEGQDSAAPLRANDLRELLRGV